MYAHVCLFDTYLRGAAHELLLRCRSRGGNQLHTNAVLEFEERLEAIKVGLSQGVDCWVWEGEHCWGLEANCLVRADLPPPYGVHSVAKKNQRRSAEYRFLSGELPCVCVVTG